MILHHHKGLTTDQIHQELRHKQIMIHMHRKEPDPTLLDLRHKQNMILMRHKDQDLILRDQILLDPPHKQSMIHMHLKEPDQILRQDREVHNNLATTPMDRKLLELLLKVDRLHHHLNEPIIDQIRQDLLHNLNMILMHLKELDQIHRQVKEKANYLATTRMDRRLPEVPLKEDMILHHPKEHITDQTLQDLHHKESMILMHRKGQDQILQHLRHKLNMIHTRHKDPDKTPHQDREKVIRRHRNNRATTLITDLKVLEILHREDMIQDIIDHNRHQDKKKVIHQHHNLLVPAPTMDLTAQELLKEDTIQMAKGRIIAHQIPTVDHNSRVTTLITDLNFQAPPLKENSTHLQRNGPATTDLKFLDLLPTTTPITELRIQPPSHKEK